MFETCFDWLVAQTKQIHLQKPKLGDLIVDIKNKVPVVSKVGLGSKKLVAVTVKRLGVM